MKRLELPTYNTKDQIYTDLDAILSYIPREDVHLAHFKTDEFVVTEEIHRVIDKPSIRDTNRNLNDYQIPIAPGLEFKIATCIFSENGKTLGLKKHIHLPKTTLPTITVGKKIYQGKDEVMFNFYRKNAPPNINIVDDFVLRFDSCTLPHEIVVNSDDQSVWLFIVFEHCNDIELEQVKNFYDCKVIYDYYG